MKKAIFAVIATALFSLSVLTTSAQSGIFGILNSVVVPDSVNYNSVGTSTDIYYLGGTFNDAIGYLLPGDTAPHLVDTTSQNYTPVSKRVYNLPANTPIRIWHLLWMSGDSVAFHTDTVSVTTALAPQQTQLTFTRVGVGIIADTVFFHYSMISQTSYVFAKYGNLQYYTDTVYLTGTGDTFVLVTSPNVSGTTYSGNELVSISTTPGINPKIVPFGSFTVPSIVHPTVGTITLGTETQTSVQWSAHLVKGNLANAQASATVYNSVNQIVFQTSFTFSSDTNIVVMPTNLPANSNFSLHVLDWNSAGLDSAIKAGSTLAYPLPTIGPWHEHDSTLTSAHIMVTGTAHGDTASMWVSYFDKNNIYQVLPSQMVVATMSDDFYLTNIKYGPNTTHGFIHMQNTTGVDSSSFSLQAENYIPVAVTSLTAPVVSYDSIKLTTVLTAGNALKDTAVFTMWDATGTNLLYTFPQILVSANGPISVVKHNMAQDSAHLFKVSITDTLHTTVYDSILVTTLQVANGTLTFADSTSATLNSTKIKVIGNTNGAWPGSVSKLVVVMQNAAGGLESDSAMNLVGAFTRTLGPFTNLKTSSNQNVGTAYLTDSAGLTTSRSISVYLPTYHPVTIASLTTPVVSYDSAKAVAVVGPGNALPDTIRYFLLDSAHNVITTYTPVLTLTGGNFPAVKHGLNEGAEYWFLVVVTDTLGTKITDSIMLTTLVTGAPQVTLSAPNKTRTTWSMDALINAEGHSAGSVVNTVYCYDQSVVIDSAVGLNITDTATITFSGNGMPGSHHIIKVKAINDDGLSGSATSTFDLLPPLQDGAPSFGYLTAGVNGDPSTIQVSGIQENVAQDNVATIKLKVEDMTNGGQTRTITIAANVTSAGPLPDYIITNCLGGDNVCVTIIDSNNVNVVTGNQECVNTLPAYNPVLADITQDAGNTTSDALAVFFEGDCGGNMCDLQMKAFDNNVQVGQTITDQVGTGLLVDYGHTWTNLDANTEYAITGILKKSDGSNPTTVTKSFWTDVSTGINGIASVPANAKEQLVVIYDMLGRKVSSGKYIDAIQPLVDLPLQIFLVIPVGKDENPFDKKGHRIGQPRKIEMISAVR